MLQLCWWCREGSQFFFPPPPYIPGCWCSSNLFGAGEGLRYCPAAMGAMSLPVPYGSLLWNSTLGQSCPELGLAGNPKVVAVFGKCLWPARERICCSTSLRSCQWCRDWAIESASCLLGKSWLICFHVFSLFHLSCSLPNCSFPLPSLSSTLLPGKQTNISTAKRNREARNWVQPLLSPLTWSGLVFPFLPHGLWLSFLLCTSRVIILAVNKNTFKTRYF